MDKRTEQALRYSIAHWERMSVMENPYTEKPLSDSCALCILFNHPYSEAELNCDGCPVKTKTGYPLCSQTPYGYAHLTWILWEIEFCNPLPNNQDACRSAFHDAARKEVEFLKSLLPKEDSDEL